MTAGAQYPSFRKPPSWYADKSRDISNSDVWLQWMVDNSLIHDFGPTAAPSCSFCGGGVSGYPTCYQCTQARKNLDWLVPASYSLDSGLESLVRHYKDFDCPWTAYPLATLLGETFERHGEHIRSQLGADPIYTWVPSDNARRRFDHIERLVTGVSTTKDMPWDPAIVRRNRDVERPRPGQQHVLINPDAYEVLKDVSGRAVLLLDDLWTSGASMGSTAAALKAAGARVVGGVVLGRQLRRVNNYGSSQAIFNEVEHRGWSFRDCVLCA